MTTQSHRFMMENKFALLTAIISLVSGLFVLVGWALDITTLKSILPIWVSMKVNTAFCFILMGVAMFMTVCPFTSLKPHSVRRLVQLSELFILLAALIGFLTLGEYFLGWHVVSG